MLPIMLFYYLANTNQVKLLLKMEQLFSNDVTLQTVEIYEKSDGCAGGVGLSNATSSS